MREIELYFGDLSLEGVYDRTGQCLLEWDLLGERASLDRWYDRERRRGVLTPPVEWKSGAASEAKGCRLAMEFDEETENWCVFLTVWPERLRK